MPIKAGGANSTGGGTMRRGGVVLATILALSSVGVLAVPEPAEALPLPKRIDSLRGMTRAIVVTSSSWRSTRAWMRLYERARKQDPWRLVRGPMAARVGYNGFSASRHEGDGTTPAGTFRFVYGFGSMPNPGLRGFGRWRRLTPSSCWSGARADYNRWVNRPCTRGESLWKNRRVAYRYAAVINFNYWHPVWRRGSGIFLHQQTGGPTAGCVSLNAGDLVAVLRWLRPGTRIAMGPTSWLTR
jgi:L,D-peptidoglycan transpeptidase YkuD (ErfK/YbiS/YcfS/YnhG family)